MFHHKYNECCFEGRISSTPVYKDDTLFFTLSVPKNGNFKIKVSVPIYASGTLAAVLHSKLSVSDDVYVETIYYPFREDNKFIVRFYIDRIFQITQNNKILMHAQD